MREFVCQGVCIGLLCIVMVSCGGEESSSGKPDGGKNNEKDSVHNTDNDTGGDGTESDGTDSFVLEGDAKFNIAVSMSSVISTVAILKWSVDVEPVDKAEVEFGPDTDYGFVAPVDVSESRYRTLLLGMKPLSEYHARIMVESNEKRYASNDFTVRTGGQPVDLPTQSISTHDEESLAGGFMLMSTFVSNEFPSSNKDYAFILDKDGDYVWWYTPSVSQADWVRARMTYDGKYMLIANGNVPGPNKGVLVKVSMDGEDEVSYPLTKRHHDVTVLPFDDIITYFEYENTGLGTCDRVMEMTPDGESREIFKVRDHFSYRETNEEWCHTNAINYVPDEDAYYISVLDFNCILKVDRSSGELLWVLGGDDSDFPGVSWSAQHQHQILEDSILIFNNRGDGTGGGFNSPSRAIEYRIDESAHEASLIWEYSSGRLNSMAMGDVNRFENGNTLIVYSASGTMHEVNSAKELLRSITWGVGSSVGYVSVRDTLYGPPKEYL